MRYLLPFASGFASLLVIYSELSFAAPSGGTLTSSSTPTNSPAPTPEKRVGGADDIKPKQKGTSVRIKWVPQFQRYLALVGVGSNSEPMRLVIDTGSLQTWVYSKRFDEEQKSQIMTFGDGSKDMFKVFTEDSKTLTASKSPKSKDFDMEYLEGHKVTVDVFEDSLVLQDYYHNQELDALSKSTVNDQVLKLSSVDLGLAKKLSGNMEGFVGSSAEGILALGVRGTDETEDVPFQSFFESAASKLETPIMKLRLPYNEDGELSFGDSISKSEIDPSSAKISRSRINSMADGRWALMMSVDGKSHNYVEVVIDTGIPIIGFYPSHFHQLCRHMHTWISHKSFITKRYNNELSQLWVKCADLSKMKNISKRFTFDLGMSQMEASIDVKHLIRHDTLDFKRKLAHPRTPDIKEEFCPLDVMRIDQGSEMPVLLGLPFFNSNVVLFEHADADKSNDGKHQISWAPQKYPQPKAGTVKTSQP